ncbi:MAG: PQQ-binding-like beta-propeller repeat protein [Oscillospiraceae bacterium]|nr:MAG: PQQ-binding-like beta-propeller repeat protein [Oscillospiraceae bacterium]
MPDIITLLLKIAQGAGSLLLIAATAYIQLRHGAQVCAKPEKGEPAQAIPPQPAPEDKLSSSLPHCCAASDPARLDFVCENDREIAPRSISFDGSYSSLRGVVTFRGDNFRSGGAYGTADIVKKRFSPDIWTCRTGRLDKTNGRGKYWTGSGWTGQPIIINWDENTRRLMNLYPDKKEKDLIEVIYPTMDGNVYFLDLEDGTPTRDKIVLGMPIKGTGSLHPAGLPIFIAGAGDSMPGRCARSFVLDLVKGEIACELGYDDPFAPRKDHNCFHGYDSSPLYDVKNDIVLQPAENGIIYTTRLNSSLENGSLKLAPEVISRTRYSNSRSGEENYWLGMESSAVMWKNYMYIADNGGNLMCYDVNTMQLIWSCDTVDDSNASPVLEEEDGNAYIYISTSLHFTKDENNCGDIPIWKINACTGEKLWQRTYRCATMAGVSGGVQATALLGKQSLGGLVYFAIARTGGFNKGLLVALDKKTGAEVWRVRLNHYVWSSPLGIYDSQGNGYVVQCDSDGNMMLFDGLTGELYDTVSLGKNIEATPAAYGNTVVVGTRTQRICGVRII